MAVETRRDATSSAGGVSRTLLFVLAVAGALTVANLYYSQPLLDRMRGSLGVSQHSIGVVAMMTQLGYGLGMLFVVPLGDRSERRRLIVWMTSLSAIALIGVAASPSFSVLVVASLALGIASSVPQLIVPFAASLAPANVRGRVVGTVMSGLLIGILLSRTIAGVVGGRLGWRAMYVIGAALMVVLAVVLRAALPRQEAERKIPYGELLRSLVSLVRDEPILRRHALLGGLGFAAFSVFWTTLSFHLASLPPHYGSEVVGAFGIIGVVGALAAPLVGRFADRFSPRAINGGALFVVLLSFIVFAVAPASLVMLGLGVVLLDLGVQSNHIANQTRIFGLDAARRNRLNTVYMTTYFAGGALGSWLSSVVYERAGWTGVGVLGGSIAALALPVLALQPKAAPGRP